MSVRLPDVEAGRHHDLVRSEAERARELIAEGLLVKLWRVPGRRENWGIWVAETADDLHAALASLPLFPWMDITVHPLTDPPNAPSTSARGIAAVSEAPSRAGSSAVPGLRGVDHIGLTVPDLEAATRFFVDVLGCTPFYDIGPIRSDTDWMSEHLGVHPRAETRLRFLRCGHGSNIELFEYSAPDQRREWPRNSDWGGHHLAFYADDFDAALNGLIARGVTILGQPTIRTEGPSAGQTWVYFLAPWGLQLELVSYPNGKLYERDTAARLWHPAHPGR